MTRALSVDLESNTRASMVNGMVTTTTSEKFDVLRGVHSKYRQKLFFSDEPRSHGGRPVVVADRLLMSLVRRLLLKGSLLTIFNAYK